MYTLNFKTTGLLAELEELGESKNVYSWDYFVENDFPTSLKRESVYIKMTKESELISFENLYKAVSYLKSA